MPMSLQGKHLLAARRSNLGHRGQAVGARTPRVFWEQLFPQVKI
jgi:hypothetical protein